MTARRSVVVMEQRRDAAERRQRREARGGAAKAREGAEAVAALERLEAVLGLPSRAYTFEFLRILADVTSICRQEEEHNRSVKRSGQ